MSPKKMAKNVGIRSSGKRMPTVPVLFAFPFALIRSSVSAGMGWGGVDVAFRVLPEGEVSTQLCLRLSPISSLQRHIGLQLPESLELRPTLLELRESESVLYCLFPWCVVETLLERNIKTNQNVLARISVVQKRNNENPLGLEKLRKANIP